MSENAAVNRMLVVANRTCPCPALLDVVAERVITPDPDVLIIAPALTTRLKHWASDRDESIEGAHQRLADARAGLAERGIDARGEIGDSQPLNAIDDALATFRAEEILIGTHPPDASHWLERGLIEQARDRFAIPVIHVESRYGLVHAQLAV